MSEVILIMTVGYNVMACDNWWNVDSLLYPWGEGSA